MDNTDTAHTTLVTNYKYCNQHSNVRIHKFT